MIDYARAEDGAQLLEDGLEKVRARQPMRPADGWSARSSADNFAPQSDLGTRPDLRH